MSNIESNELNDNLESNPSQVENNSKESDTDLAAEALNHLQSGQRFLLLEDFSSAVASLQESCLLFDKKYGIGAEECGDAYLHYGTALLELARIEDGLFDGVIHTKLAELSETEEDEEEEEVEEDSQDTEDNESADKKSEGKKTDTEEDIEESDEEKKKLHECNASSSTSGALDLSESTAGNTSSEPSTCLPSTSKAESDDDNEENEASNIEVSWEVLSLAKNVFKRNIEKPGMKLKLAESLQKLGEISIEWENNQNAIEILTESLTLRKEVLPEDDRLIAETYYHLGIAFSFSNDCENANNCFQSAIQVIETRIENLRKSILTTSTENVTSIASIEKEISQLENLLPEMRLKIEDSKDQMENACKALEDEANERIKEDEIALKAQEVKEMPINDISHLIKRKRQNSGSETNARKSLCSNGHNVINNDETND